MAKEVKKFRTSTRVTFEVEEGKTYSERQISARYRKYLLSLRPGHLVGVHFYGTLTPLVTVDGGVIRLTKVKVGSETLTRASDIARALGLKEAKVALPLTAA